MTKAQISSILNPIVTEARNRIDRRAGVGEIKQYVITEVNKHVQMNANDRLKIIADVGRQADCFQLLKYLYNAILKYEGCGTIRF